MSPDAPRRAPCLHHTASGLLVSHLCGWGCNKVQLVHKSYCANAARVSRSKARRTRREGTGWRCDTGYICCIGATALVAGVLLGGSMRADGAAVQVFYHDQSGTRQNARRRRPGGRDGLGPPRLHGARPRPGAARVAVARAVGHGPPCPALRGALLRRGRRLHHLPAPRVAQRHGRGPELGAAERGDDRPRARRRCYRRTSAAPTR